LADWDFDELSIIVVDLHWNCVGYS